MLQTQAQQFAALYAADMASQMLRTIKWVRRAATAIMVIAMVVSYSHQAGYLASIGTPALGSWLIPGALDTLTFLCVKVLGTPGMAQPAKRVALRVLVFPVLASSAINFMAPGQLVTKSVFVLAVLMIPAAELVASRIKPDFGAMDAMERAVTFGTEVSDEERERRSAAARKAAATRKANVAAKAKTKRTPRAPQAARTPVEEIQSLMDVAPVSPATAEL
jgi:hypothetical protein